MTKYTTNYLPCGDDKKPFGGNASWMKFKTTLYKGDFKKYPKRGIITGGISDGLTALDFDNHSGAGCIFTAFVERLKEQGGADILKRCTIETTPRDGVHLYYRAHDLQRAEDLAKRSKAGGGVEDIIELKAAGAFVCCYPSAGYKLTQGTIESAEYITNEQQALLLSVARSFNKVESNKPKASTNNNNNQLPTNNDDDSAAEFLRTKQARPILQQALTSAGYLAIKEHTSDDFGDCIDYAHERANDQKAKLTLCRDNVLHIWAGSVYGGIECAQDKDLTPLQALALLRHTTESETAAYIRREYMPTLPPLDTVDVDALIDNNDDSPEYNSFACWYQNNRDLFPAFIVNAVESYATRTNYPQRNLYAFNLLSVCGLWADHKARREDSATEYKTRFNLLNIAETAAGKDGVLTPMKRLVAKAYKARYDARGVVSRHDIDSNNDDTAAYMPACYADVIISEQDFYVQLARLATVDRVQEQRRAMTNKIERGAGTIPQHGRAVYYLTLDEGGDYLTTMRDKNNSNATNVKRALKSILESNGKEPRLLDAGIKQATRFKDEKLDAALYLPSVSCSMFSALNILESFNQEDFTGGLVGRFMLAVGQRRRDVEKIDVFAAYNPDDLTALEIAVLESIAKQDSFIISISADVEQYANKKARAFRDTAPTDNLASDATARLQGRFSSFVVLSAIINKVYNDVLNDAERRAEDDDDNKAGSYEVETVLDQLAADHERRRVVVSCKDVDFAAACLEYCRACCVWLLENITSDSVDTKTRYNHDIEQAILNALKRCRDGLSISTLYNNRARYGLKRLKPSIETIGQQLETFRRSRLVCYDEETQKYYLKAKRNNNNNR